MDQDLSFRPVPGHRQDPAVILLFDELVRIPIAFDAVALTVLSCTTQASFQGDAALLFRTNGLDPSALPKLWRALEGFYNATPGALNNRRGALCEMLFDFVAPIGLGSQFSRHHEVIVFWKGTQICQCNVTVDFFYVFSNHRAEAYDCKTNCDGFLHQPIPDRCRRKLACLQRIAEVLKQNRISSVVAISTLSQRTSIAQKILEQEGFPGITIVPYETIRELFVGALCGSESSSDVSTASTALRNTAYSGCRSVTHLATKQ